MGQAGNTMQPSQPGHGEAGRLLVDLGCWEHHEEGRQETPATVSRVSLTPLAPRERPPERPGSVPVCPLSHAPLSQQQHLTALYS